MPCTGAVPVAAHPAPHLGGGAVANAQRVDVGGAFGAEPAAPPRGLLEEFDAALEVIDFSVPSTKPPAPGGGGGSSGADGNTCSGWRPEGSARESGLNPGEVYKFAGVSAATAAVTVAQVVTSVMTMTNIDGGEGGGGASGELRRLLREGNASAYVDGAAAAQVLGHKGGTEARLEVALIVASLLLQLAVVLVWHYRPSGCRGKGLLGDLKASVLLIRRPQWARRACAMVERRGWRVPFCRARCIGMLFITACVWVTALQMWLPGANVRTALAFYAARTATVAMIAAMIMFGSDGFDTGLEGGCVRMSRVATAAVAWALPAVLARSALPWWQQLGVHALFARHCAFSLVLLPLSGIGSLAEMRAILRGRGSCNCVVERGDSTSHLHSRLCTRAGLAMFLLTHIAMVTGHALPTAVEALRPGTFARTPQLVGSAPPPAQLAAAAALVAGHALVLRTALTLARRGRLD